MDKIFLLLVTVGLCIFAVAFTLFMGWLFDDDRRNNKQLDNDSDMHIYVPHRSGNRSSNNRHNK